MQVCFQTVTTASDVAFPRCANAEAHDSGALFFADCGLRGSVMSDHGLQPFSFRQKNSKAELVGMTDSALKIGKIWKDCHFESTSIDRCCWWISWMKC